MLGSEAQLAQAAADVENALLILLVSEEGEGRQLEELPLLVDLLNLAIDHFLDLLHLSVEVDKLARADGIMVGVDASASADEVEDGANLLDRSVDEAILCGDVASGNALAGNLGVAWNFDGKRWLAHLRQGHQALRVVWAGHGSDGRSRLEVARRGRRVGGSEEHPGITSWNGLKAAMTTMTTMTTMLSAVGEDYVRRRGR